MSPARHTLRASKVHADSRTQRERQRGQAERAAIQEEHDTAEQWYAEGRVPGGRRGGYSTKVGGPFDTAAEAFAWAKSYRLGGVRVWNIHHHEGGKP